jgi:mannosyltransferase OCH1-like enzyme
MIEKYIHYCWFGTKELPNSASKCIESWKKFMPNFKVILWNEDNSPMDNPYLKSAYENKKWSNVSNFVRLHALKQMGGWYFDTDVELLKSPDLSKYNETCFLGIETKPHEKPCLVNGAVIVAKKNHSFVNQCIESLILKFDGKEPANLSCPILITEELEKIGFRGKPTSIQNVRILSNDYFYPSAWYEDFDESMITKNTISVHHADSSWFPISEMTELEIITLIKENNQLKSSLSKYTNSMVSFKDLTKFVVKYFLSFLKRK